MHTHPHTHTPPHTAPGSPTELTINHTSSSTTLLRWTPVPTNLQNGIITGYIILATSMSRNHSYSADGDTLELELMGLRGYTVYNFSEAAETTGGRGQPLVVTSRTPQGGGYLGSNIKWCTCMHVVCMQLE